MRESLIDHLVEHTDGDSTCFSLTCSICGAVWKSVALPGLERKTAAQEAVKQTHMCPFCGRTVCENCFINVEGITLCSRCGQRLRARIEE